MAQQLMETTTKLELAEVNLSQLRATNVEDQYAPQTEYEELTNRLEEKETELARITQENEEHVKRVAELTAHIQQASHDREQIIQQYTSYSQQLASQIETLTQQLNVKASENHGFAKREADLVSHVQR